MPVVGVYREYTFNYKDVGFKSVGMALIQVESVEPSSSDNNLTTWIKDSSNVSTTICVCDRNINQAIITLHIFGTL